MTEKNKAIQRRCSHPIRDASCHATQKFFSHISEKAPPVLRYREKKKEILLDLRSQVERLNDEVAHLKLERDSLEDRNRVLGKSLELRTGTATSSSQVSTQFSRLCIVLRPDLCEADCSQSAGSTSR